LDTNTYRLAIVIVTFNDKELVSPCLKSVFNNKSRGWSFTVCVVDNGSSDGTPEYIQQNFPEVNLIRNQSNLGYPNANNKGIKNTSSQYVLLLNPDTEIPQNTFQELIGLLDADDSIGIVGPKLIRRNGELDFACRRMFPNYLDYLLILLGLARKFPESKVLGRYNLTYLNPDESTDVDSVAGAFLMARRDAIEKIGLLDESFFIYGEDIDWCYRFRLNGWRVFYYPKVTVLHHKGGTSKRFSHYLIYHFYRSNTILYNKYIAKRTFFVFNWLMYGVLWIKFCISYVHNLLLPSDKKRVA
jgi:hypothetical protein